MNYDLQLHFSLIEFELGCYAMELQVVSSELVILSIDYSDTLEIWIYE